MGDFMIAGHQRRRYYRIVTALQKKIVFDEKGQPCEVIIPWEQFCELSEALGLDLDAEAVAELREATQAWRSGDHSSFVPLSEV